MNKFEGETPSRIVVFGPMLAGLVPEWGWVPDARPVLALREMREINSERLQSE
ncbi:MULTISPECIES: hypothetical protein [Kaistia]|uniref:Uncharacterized protein n=1 Tax=Kaistia nematophila TaxID=2994654 RepID=A0A9X3E5V9_9HYPH|nr:hypothetical protein [Kaistia nematophila]MBN9059364.1 hypothetical protein [Hyphomicrobiales bacterium]MCX5571297.1 hypothetical protein [Kaistia nematophila]